MLSTLPATLYLCLEMMKLVLLTLQESYSLPVLMYAIPALSLKSRQVDELNVCWNNVFRRILNYNKWKSLKAVILRLGRINLKLLLSPSLHGLQAMLDICSVYADCHNLVI